MKKQTALGLILLTACLGGVAAACGDSTRDSGASDAGGTSGVLGSGGATASGGVTGSSNAVTGKGGATSSSNATSRSGGSSNTSSDASGGVGGTSSDTGASGTGNTCELPSLAVFSRSDTDQCWDNDDFSDVTLEVSCPVLVNVTWPHEEGWENADPAESNREPTRFTLDSSYSTDLTGKQINLTIELTADERGPNATAGGYVVSLVSVSSFSRVVGSGKPAAVEPNCAVGGAAGAGGSTSTDAGGSTSTNAGGSTTTIGQGGAGGGTGTGSGGTGTGSGGTGTGSGGTGTGSGGGGADSGGADTGSGGVAGSGTGEEVPVTETGYTEAISSPADGATLRRVGDKATLSFALPNKTEEVDSYDPTRVIKINVRIQTVFSSADTPARVYDYISSQFAITKFTVTDAVQ